MLSITLDTRDCATIAAMAKHIAPAKDDRYYLRGVMLECTPRGWLAIATDGCVLTVALLNNAARYPAQDGTQIIIPRDMAASLVPKGKNGHRVAVLSFDLEKGPRVLCVDGTTTITIPPEFAGYAFPDWRRVVPVRPTGDAAQFNPALLARVQSVAAAMGAADKDLGYLWHNGPLAACVTFSAVDLYAIVSPLRGDRDTAPPRPIWVLDDASAAAVAAVEAIQLAEHAA